MTSAIRLPCSRSARRLSCALQTVLLGALSLGCRSEPSATSTIASASVSVAASAAPPAASAASSARPVPTAEGTRLVLLGTKGGPRVGAPGTPRNPATLVLVNGVPYVVDVGYGTSSQLVGAGVALNSVRHVFITHHHSDHMLELGPLLYNAWVTGLRAPVNVYGPPGTSKMVDDFLAYMKLDIETRIEDEGRPDLRKLVSVKEFKDSGSVLENDEVKVTAARVKHPPIVQAYAYRFDVKGRSLVISGDTAHDPSLAAFAKNADFLVHEVMHPERIDLILKRVPNATTLREHLFASHTVPEDVGKIAAAASVKTLVLTHFVPGDDANLPDATWTEGVKKHFSGRVIVGKDLMDIPF